MSLHRRAAKRDANEGPIVAALEAAGFWVQRMSQKGMPDLYIYKAGQSHFVEVKSAKGKLTRAQKAWVGQPVVILRSLADVEQFLKGAR